MDVLPFQQDYVLVHIAALNLSSANCFCSISVLLGCRNGAFCDPPQTGLTQFLLQKSRAKLPAHCVKPSAGSSLPPSLPLLWFPCELGPVFVIMAPEPGSLPDMWYSLNVYWKNGIICCFHNEHGKRMIKVEMISSDIHKWPGGGGHTYSVCFLFWGI